MIVAMDATGNALIFNITPFGRWISNVHVASEVVRADGASLVVGAGEALGRTETKVKSLLDATPADTW